MEAIRKHETMNNVYNYLAENWHIGIITAFSAWIVANLNFMFDQDVLKMVGGCGIYIGIFVGVLTAISKMFDLYDNIRKRFK